MGFDIYAKQTRCLICGALLFTTVDEKNPVCGGANCKEIGEVEFWCEKCNITTKQSILKVGKSYKCQNCDFIKIYPDTNDTNIVVTPELLANPAVKWLIDALEKCATISEGLHQNQKKILEIVNKPNLYWRSNDALVTMLGEIKGICES